VLSWAGPGRFIAAFGNAMPAVTNGGVYGETANNFLIAGSSILMIVMAIETLAVMLISVIVWR